MRGHYGLLNFLEKDNISAKIFKFCEEESVSRVRNSLNNFPGPLTPSLSPVRGGEGKVRGILPRFPSPLYRNGVSIY